MNTHLGGLWDRSLDYYPNNARRIWYLALAVIATITVYYESFTLASVAPLVQADFHLPLSHYVYSVILANSLGALAALLGSLSDRVGRGNLIVSGLLVTCICTLAMSLVTSLWPFLFMYWALGFTQGMILTVTPALVRDFSPRLGRAAAMGFWTVGSVGGNFLAAIVASLTLFVFHSWRSQYAIAGGVGMVVFLVCLIGLRELSPGLRAQVMNSLRDKGLVEARAGRIDIEATLRHPWRQILRTRLLINALGINLFLLIYVVARNFFVIFLSTSFNFPLAQANGMVSVFFLVILISSILVGFISDKMRVRKPFMLIGSSSLVIVTLIFTSRTGQLTSDALMTVLLALIGLCISITFVPWVAAYTETVEDINPALVATGIAVEVFISRWVAIIAILALPVVIGNGQGWQVWWWVCIAGQIMFLPTILTISGQWNPARARDCRSTRMSGEP